jgi:hypothetical protein
MLYIFRAVLLYIQIYFWPTTAHLFYISYMFRLRLFSRHQGDIFSTDKQQTATCHWMMYIYLPLNDKLQTVAVCKKYVSLMRAE